MSKFWFGIFHICVYFLQNKSICYASSKLWNIADLFSIYVCIAVTSTCRWTEEDSSNSMRMNIFVLTVVILVIVSFMTILLILCEMVVSKYILQLQCILPISGCLLWSPCVIGQTIIFSSCSFFLSFFSSPNLSGRRLDVYHTLAHGVALVRI